VLSEVKPEDTADKVNHININTDEIEEKELGFMKSRIQEHADFVI
jgi:hypothetical protein